MELSSNTPVEDKTGVQWPLFSESKRKSRRNCEGGDMRTLTTMFAVAVLLCAIAGTAKAQAQMSDAEYTKKALSAAPAAVAEGAAVVRFDKDGSMRTLRAGKNGFTCI